MPARILIVDDMEFNRELTARMLSIHGYEIIFAHNGRDAIDVAKQQLPDLILMDIGLPDIDGWKVTEVLKNTKTTMAIPIIALSAHDSADYKEKSKFNGCAGYITKPVDFDILLEQITTSINSNSPELI